MELLRIAMCTLCHQGEGSLHLAHADGPLATCGIAHSTRMSHIRNSASLTFHPNVSHLEFFSVNIPSGYFASGAWRRMGEEGVSTSPVRHIRILWKRLPGEFRSHFAQCRGVLLKLPDMCDQNFEIFCFRYLMSKSPKSPYNPPIIGFLSL